MTTTRPNRLAEWRASLIVEQRSLDPAVRQRLHRIAGALFSVGAVAFTTLVIGVATRTGFHELDAPVEAWFNERVTAATTEVMIVLAVLFGPVALPIIVLVTLIAWIAVARQVWRPMLLAGGMTTGVVLALIISPLVQHPRPPVGLMLFGPDRTFSFPSGHVLGTADFVLILAYLLASRIQHTWFTLVACAVALLFIGAQVFSRLYLGYHWFSDTMGSIALSLVILGAVIAVDVRVNSRP